MDKPVQKRGERFGTGAQPAAVRLKSGDLPTQRVALRQYEIRPMSKSETMFNLGGLAQAAKPFHPAFQIVFGHFRPVVHRYNRVLIVKPGQRRPLGDGNCPHQQGFPGAIAIECASQRADHEGDIGIAVI